MCVAYCLKSLYGTALLFGRKNKNMHALVQGVIWPYQHAADVRHNATATRRNLTTANLRPRLGLNSRLLRMVLDLCEPVVAQQKSGAEEVPCMYVGLQQLFQGQFWPVHLIFPLPVRGHEIGLCSHSHYCCEEPAALLSLHIGRAYSSPKTSRTAGKIGEIAG